MDTFVNDYKCLGCEHCFKKNPTFNLLSEHELCCLDEARMEVSFKTGEIIYKQGTPLTHIVIINTGLGKIYFEGQNERNLILCYTLPYDINGGIGIFLDERHHSTLMAMTDCDACFIDVGVFKATYKSNPSFLEAYLAEHTKRVLHTYKQFSILTQKNMEGRMAESLLYFDDNGFGKGSFKHIPKADWSELTAMTRESAIRVLKEFKDEGIIKIENQSIEILNKKALKKIAFYG